MREKGRNRKLYWRLSSHKKKKDPLSGSNSIYVQIFPLAFLKKCIKRLGICYFPKWEQVPQDP